MNKLINIVIGVFLAALFLISFSPGLIVSIIVGNVDNTLSRIYFEHRFQSLMLFLGAMLLLGGIKVINTKYFVIKKRNSLFKKDKLSLHEENNIEFKGNVAVKIGLVFIFWGFLAVAWSISFWIQYVVPVIFRAMV